MSNMSLQKALLIFGIKDNYNEDDLKKRYRKLIKENHPDYHMNVSKEEYEKYTKKSQDINEAYEVLKRNLNSKSIQQSDQEYNYRQAQATVNLIIAKEKAIKEITNYLKKCDAEKLMQQVNELIIDYVTKIKKCSDINEIIIVQLCFKLDLKTLYKDYISLYIKKHHIPSFIISSKKIDYDSDCSNLFLKLKECERTISQDISKIIRKYHSNEHFKVLENKILEERDKLKERISYDITKEEYHKMLDEYDNKINSMIIDYKRKYRKFKSQLDKISSQFDPNTRKYLYDNIEKIVLKLDESKISNILSDILKEEHEKLIPSKIREEIYSELRKKYLNNVNITNFDINNELFTKVVELLYSQNCTMKLAYEINKITFSKPKEELEKLIKLSNNNEFIYIKISRESPIHKIHKAKQISHKGKRYYELKNIKVEDELIDEKTFKKDYIHIDDFLSNAFFLGYRSNLEPICQILYLDFNSKKAIIRYVNEKIFATVESTIIFQVPFTRDKSTDIYKNKDFLKEEISKCFDQEYKKNHNNNKRR